MVDRNPAKKPETANKQEGLVRDALIEMPEKTAAVRVGKKSVKKNGVAGEKKKKAG